MTPLDFRHHCVPSFEQRAGTYFLDPYPNEELHLKFTILILLIFVSYKAWESMCTCDFKCIYYMKLLFKVSLKNLELVKLAKKRVEPIPKMVSVVSVFMDLCSEWSEKLATPF